MSILTELWLPLVVAAIVCGVAIGAMRLFSRAVTGGSPAPRRWAHVAGPVGLACGLVALHLWHMGMPAWPPPDLTGRLLPAFVLAGVWGAAGGLSRRPHRVGAWGFVSTVAAVATVLWPALAMGSADRTVSASIVVGVSVAAGVACACLAALEQRGHSVAAAIILIGLSFASGGAVLGSGSLTLGQYGLGVGAAAIGVWIVALLAHERFVGGAACGALAMCAGLLVAANRYSELRPIPPVMFAVCAPAALAAARLLSRKLSPVKSGTVAVLVAAALAAVAVRLCLEVSSGTGEATASGEDSGYGP